MSNASSRTMGVVEGGPIPGVMLWLTKGPAASCAVDDMIARMWLLWQLLEALGAADSSGTLSGPTHNMSASLTPQILCCALVGLSMGKGLDCCNKDTDFSDPTSPNGCLETTWGVFSRGKLEVAWSTSHCLGFKQPFPVSVSGNAGAVASLASIKTIFSQL